MPRNLKKALFFGEKIENKEAKSKKGGKTTFSANSNSQKTLSQKPTKRGGAGPAEKERREGGRKGEKDKPVQTAKPLQKAGTLTPSMYQYITKIRRNRADSAREATIEYRSKTTTTSAWRRGTGRLLRKVHRLPFISDTIVSARIIVTLYCEFSS